VTSATARRLALSDPAAGGGETVFDRRGVCLPITPTTGRVHCQSSLSRGGGEFRLYTPACKAVCRAVFQPILGQGSECQAMRYTVVGMISLLDAARPKSWQLSRLISGMQMIMQAARMNSASM